MAKSKNRGLQPPKIKPKTYYTPEKDETFIVIINPPRKTLPNGQMEPNANHIQTWLSAIAQRPNGVASEMYVIKTHEEPIVRLEGVDINSVPMLGLHRWREIIRDLNPESALWNEQTVIAEYDAKRFNHPKNIQYQIIDLANPDPAMYADVKQPYPRPHRVDISRNDFGLRVSSKAKQIVDMQSLMSIPEDPPNGAVPKQERDPWLDQVFDGIKRDVEAKAKVSDPWLDQVFEGIKRDVKIVPQDRDRRAEVVVDGVDDYVRGDEGYERSRPSASGSVSPVKVKQEAVPVKEEDDALRYEGSIFVKQENVHVKQEIPSVKREDVASDDDPWLRQVFHGIKRGGHPSPLEPTEDVKPFTSRGSNSPDGSSVTVKEEANARPFSSFGPQTELKADPDTPSAVKQEDHTHPVQFSGDVEHDRGTFPPPTPDGFSRGGPVKRERDAEDAQASKRFKTEYY